MDTEVGFILSSFPLWLAPAPMCPGGRPGHLLGSFAMPLPRVPLSSTPTPPCGRVPGPATPLGLTGLAGLRVGLVLTAFHGSFVPLIWALGLHSCPSPRPLPRLPYSSQPAWDPGAKWGTRLDVILDKGRRHQLCRGFRKSGFGQ